MAAAQAMYAYATASALHVFLCVCACVSMASQRSQSGAIHTSFIGQEGDSEDNGHNQITKHVENSCPIQG